MRGPAAAFQLVRNRSLTLTGIRPYDVASHVEQLLTMPRPPERPSIVGPVGVKQELAAVRMLFNCWSPGKSCR